MKLKFQKKKIFMNWHEFVFSNKPTIRLGRHLLFWMLWWLYFAATYYYYVQVGLQKIDFGDLSIILLVNSFFLVLVHLSACYIFIYILLPFLFQAKYMALAAGTTLLCAFLLAVGYLIQGRLFPYIDLKFNYTSSSSNATIWWTSINSILLNAPKVIAAATVIKLIKRWYSKQKEKERLEKEKLITDLQLLKAQIHPGFLFKSLDHIYRYAQIKSMAGPELLLKLSDMLSYMLYECDNRKVSLKKELIMMKEYLNIEKMGFNNPVELEMTIKGDAANKFIAPLLLLPFIENGFKLCSKLKGYIWLNLDISIDSNNLTMKLMHGISVSDPIITTDDILNVQKRLQLLYPDKHQLKMYAENEIYVVLLKINLDGRSVEPPVFSDGSNKNKSEKVYAG